jgi:hypothetical protein
MYVQETLTALERGEVAVRESVPPRAGSEARQNN